MCQTYWFTCAPWKWFKSKFVNLDSSSKHTDSHTGDSLRCHRIICNSISLLWTWFSVRLNTVFGIWAHPKFRCAHVMGYLELTYPEIRWTEARCLLWGGEASLASLRENPCWYICASMRSVLRSLCWMWTGPCAILQHVTHTALYICDIVDHPSYKLVGMAMCMCMIPVGLHYALVSLWIMWPSMFWQ